MIDSKSMDRYKYLHDIAMRYGNGETHLATEIVDAFSDFIWKHVNILKVGIGEKPDNYALKFIKLFVSDLPQGVSSNRFFFSYTVKNKITNTSSHLKSLLSGYSEDDLRSEMIIALLELAKAYSKLNNGSPSFHTYVLRIFHFKVARIVHKLTKDPLNRDPICFEDEKFNSLCEYLEEETLLEEFDISVCKRRANICEDISIFENKFLDQHWINGLTCSVEFKILTKHERVILIEHSVNKKTDSEIADMFGLCRATINRRRLKAIGKLKFFLEN